MSDAVKPQRYKRPKMLYRKVNTKARGVHHHFGGDYRHVRNGKGAESVKMKRGVRRGLDYTPLYMFLLSKLGQAWDGIYAEAVNRLDHPDPIFHLVARSPEQQQAVVCVGESTYYSGLYVDAQGFLQKVAPELGPEHLEPRCACCTHTFNGKRLVQKYTPD